MWLTAAPLSCGVLYSLHYHFIGSYTSSGTGTTSMGNLEAIQAAFKQDMGIFIISPSDKGGMLYKPSKCMARACDPFSPIVFNDLWLWTHADPPIHTLVVGAARPTDFDEHVDAAKEFMALERIGSFEKVKDIEHKLMSMYNEVWGDWANDCKSCFLCVIRRVMSVNDVTLTVCVHLDLQGG